MTELLRNFWVRIVGLAIIDFVVIWWWVKLMDPDPSVSIALIILVPFVVFVNLVIALILYFKKSNFSSLFLTNTIIAGILMYYLFGKGVDRNLNRRVEGWTFNIQDTTFRIDHWKLEDTYDISESPNPGSSTSFLRGKFEEKGNEYYLTTDSTVYRIKDDYLFGFRSPLDSIKLTKMER
jgi:hypothetical protein